MKKIPVLFAFLALIPHFVRSQIDLGLPSATGKGGTSTAMVTNFEAIGINPSNLGWSNNYKFSITLANFGMNMQSKAIDFQTLKNAVLNPTDSFTLAQKQDYANRFATPEGFNMTGNMNWLATSFYIPKIGGFAINVRDRVYAHVGLNQNAADFIFLGKNASFFQDTANYHQNLSTIFDGCDVSLLHYREANIAYGRKLLSFGKADADGDPIVQLYGGVGFKLLWGLANIDGKISPGFIAGHSAITSSYNIDYGNIHNFTSINTNSFFNSVGQGTAIDLGASIVVAKKFRVGVSATDIGGITWKNNVLVAHDTTLFHPDSTNNGLPNWALGQHTGALFGNDGFMNYQAGVDYKSTLPSKIRFGVGWKLNNFMDIGADVVIPYTKNRYNLSTPYMAVGAELKLGAAVRANIGVSGNGAIGWNLPVGVSLGPVGPFEFGLATGDVLTFLSKSKDPNMSFALGFIRVNIDPTWKDMAAGSNQPPTPGL